MGGCLASSPWELPSELVLQQTGELSGGSEGQDVEELRPEDVAGGDEALG